MRKINTDYLFEYTRHYYEATDYEALTLPHYKVVNDGVVLPALKDSSLPWGIGGIIDSNNMFVEESKHDDVFGGEYIYDKTNTKYCNETVIYIGVIPKHWGHLIIDVLSKLWFVEQNPGISKIVYVGLDWMDGINGAYEKLIELCGVKKEQLLFVTKPTRFNKIIIPERTLGFRLNYNATYLTVINTIIKNVESEAVKRKLHPIDKIYFTRLNFSKARTIEVGEREIASLFEKNGFKIVSPEQLDVVEQIYLFHHCKEFVCINGTLAHNVVFSNSNTKLTVLNRVAIPNPPQLRINQMMGLDCTFVDVFNKRELRHQKGYTANDTMPRILEFNSNLKRYFGDNKLLIPNNNILNSIMIRIRNSTMYYYLVGRKVFIRVKKLFSINNKKY